MFPRSKKTPDYRYEESKNEVRRSEGGRTMSKKGKDGFLGQLEADLWELIQRAAPTTPEEREFLVEFQKWNAAGADVARKAQALAAQDRGYEAQLLVEQHNAAQPRRRPGRPTRKLPPRRFVQHALLLSLCELALPKIDPSTAHRAVETAFSRLQKPKPE